MKNSEKNYSLTSIHLTPHMRSAWAYATLAIDFSRSVGSPVFSMGIAADLVNLEETFTSAKASPLESRIQELLPKLKFSALNDDREINESDFDIFQSELEQRRALLRAYRAKLNGKHRKLQQHFLGGVCVPAGLLWIAEDFEDEVQEQFNELVLAAVEARDELFENWSPKNLDTYWNAFSQLEALELYGDLQEKLMNRPIAISFWSPPVKEASPAELLALKDELMVLELLTLPERDQKSRM